MKVFLSWSGTTSHCIAKILRDWLPSVIQSIEPYVSSEDIDKGTRWSSDIAGELDASDYGIICLTPDNLEAPWINFEAGSLGKSVEKSRVSPVLFRLKKSDLKGPLLQFQATVFEKDDVQQLMNSLNNALGEDSLDTVRLNKSFERWWPELESLLSEVQAPAAEPSVVAPNALIPAQLGSILEELIDLTRANHKLLRDPGALFPPEFRGEPIRSREGVYSALNAAAEVMITLDKIYGYIEEHRESLQVSPDFAELEVQLGRLGTPARSGARILRKVAGAQKGFFFEKGSLLEAWHIPKT